MDQEVLCLGTIGNEDPYLDFVFWFPRVQRLHVDLHDAEQKNVKNKVMLFYRKIQEKKEYPYVEFSLFSCQRTKTSRSGKNHVTNTNIFMPKRL